MVGRGAFRGSLEVQMERKLFLKGRERGRLTDYADGEPLPDDVATLLPPLILPAFADKPGAAEALADAISQRPQRSKAYL